MGSPATVLNYLRGLKDNQAPFVPGVMLAWELMVGNSNTRWIGGPPCDPASTAAREPMVPWCGLLFPDGTPVSYTEAGLVRQHLTGRDPFLFISTWLEDRGNLSGDEYLTVNRSWSWPVTKGGPGYMVEAAALITGDAGLIFAWGQAKDTAQLSFAAENLTLVTNAGARATFHTAHAEAGVLGGWSIVRVICSPGSRTGTIRWRVWLNPVLSALDPTLGTIDPVIEFEETDSPTAGPELLKIEPLGVSGALVDYISILPEDGGVSPAAPRPLIVV